MASDNPSVRTSLVLPRGWPNAAGSCFSAPLPTLSWSADLPQWLLGGWGDLGRALESQSVSHMGVIHFWALRVEGEFNLNYLGLIKNCRLIAWRKSAALLDCKKRSSVKNLQLRLTAWPQKKVIGSESADSASLLGRRLVFFEHLVLFETTFTLKHETDYTLVVRCVGSQLVC